MMKVGLLALGLFAYATPAHAQMTWPNKGFFAVDFGVQLATHEFDTDAEFSLYEENGRLQTAQEGKNSPFIEFRGGYKVWKNLLVGVGYSWTSSKSDVAITASIPDPVVHDHLRTANLTAADAGTSEGALDFSGTWMVPVTDKIDVGVLAGPTVFFVKKDVASSVTATEPGPVATATITEESETNVGFHLGVDLHYTINKQYAVGGLARYSYGKVDMSTGPAKVGGFQLGAGVRYRF